MGQIGCPETSVTNYQSTPRNITKDRDASLKSRFFSCYTSNVLQYVPYEYATGYCSVVSHTCCKLLNFAIQYCRYVHSPPPHGARTLCRQRFSRYRYFTITPRHTLTHSVGLLRQSDRPVVETSTWQHTTLTTDRHQCPQRYSNPQSCHSTGYWDRLFIASVIIFWILRLRGMWCLRSMNVMTGRVAWFGRIYFHTGDVP